MSSVDETVSAYDLDAAEVVRGAGWTDVIVRPGIEGMRGETWLRVSAVRATVSS